MSYEIDEIQASHNIFAWLLEHHELSQHDNSSLYAAYTENEKVQTLVQSQGMAAQCSVVRYGDIIYIIPSEENLYLGFSKAELKQRLCKSNALNRDYYLAMFVIMVLLTSFYDGQGPSAKTRDFMKTGDLQNEISHCLEMGAERSEEEQSEEGIAFTAMKQSYEALRSQDTMNRRRTTKEGFLYNILKFLEEQGLINYVEKDEMIMTTEKLDRFMDANLLNSSNFDRVKRILEEDAHEQD
jgi:uncharacterized protein YqgQ